MARKIEYKDVFPDESPFEKLAKRAKKLLDEYSTCKEQQTILRNLSILGNKDAGRSLSLEFKREKVLVHEIIKLIYRK